MRTSPWTYVAAFVLAALPAHAKFREKKNLKSPIPSDVSGLTIPNSHYVALGKGTVVRGMHPLGKAKELKKFGVTDVLIFKTETRDEVRRERDELRRAGYTDDHIIDIPFAWDELPPFAESCRQTLQALKLLGDVVTTEGRTLFFHCTVGEDRTGYLAGLFRILHQYQNPADVFQKELCENGYASGDPDPSKETAGVNAKIGRGLTPLFFRMAALIEEKKLTTEHLDSAVCNDEAQATRLAEAKGYLGKTWNCAPSPKARIPKEQRR